MAIKKSDRKKRYIEVLSLMLKAKNKEAFEKLILMCGEDVGVYLLTDYDSAIEDINSRDPS